MKNIILSLNLMIVLTILNACTKPSSNIRPSDSNLHSRSPQNTFEFVEGIKKVLTDINTKDVFNSESCPNYIYSYTDALYQKPTDYFAPKTESEKQMLIAKHMEILNDLNLIKIMLRKRLKEFVDQNIATEKCINAIRRGLRYARFSEEFLIEYLSKLEVFKSNSELILDQKFPYTSTNPDFQNFKIQAGDVLLIRGKSYVSAMIARMGDEEAQFSHLAIVGSDDKNKLYVIESLIQNGVIITPLAEWLKKEESRVALFRMQDSDLAKKAARSIYDKTYKKIKSGGTLKYDFKMDYVDHSQIFCAEIVSWAYEMASDGKVKVPLYLTKVSKFKNTSYIRDLGLNTDVLFEPADIEVDPRFDFVAEYRLLSLTRQVRSQDAVMTSIYNWMIKHNYEFRTNVEVNIKGVMAKILRQFGLLKEKMPSYMPLGTIFTTLKFEAVATALEKNIYAKENEFFKKNGHSLAFKDMLEINENYRLNDCKKHKDYIDKNPLFESDTLYERDPSTFHWFFYSPAKSCQI